MSDNETVIVAAAFCPQPPLLHPELGSPGDANVAALRSACKDALYRILGPRAQGVLVLGAANDASSADTVYRRGDAGELSGDGVAVRQRFDGPPAQDGARLPLAHTLAAWLLDEAGFTGPRLGLVAGARSPKLGSAVADGRGWALLVMGDGSARRTERSPGWYDAEAVAFDDTVVGALSGGDGDVLLDVDQAIAHRVLAAGVVAWHEAGTILQGRAMTPRLHYADAPFGVFYVVASWVTAQPS